jgi:hypothetical protein
MDEDWSGGYAGVDYYFIAENGQTFKTTLRYSPYFYIGCKVTGILCLTLLLSCTQFTLLVLTIDWNRNRSRRIP